MRYTVDLELDETDWWFASIREVKGCYTQGRSIRQAMSRIREALSVCIDEKEAKAAEFSIDVHLPTEAREAVARYETASERLERQRQATREAANEAVILLTDDLHLSVRDIADILGLSHQRVHQLVRAKE